MHIRVSKYLSCLSEIIVIRNYYYSDVFQALFLMMDAFPFNSHMSFLFPLAPCAYSTKLAPEQKLCIAQNWRCYACDFKRIPEKNNQTADAVIGKRDFKTGSENKDTIVGTDSSLYWPFSICTQEDKLVVADTGNHRLSIMDILL